MKLRSREAIELLKVRDGDFCRVPDCRNPKVFTNKNFRTVDHVLPKAKGGTDDLENLVIAHLDCNSRKGDRLILPDGTLEPVPVKKQKNKVIKKDPCTKCNEGRSLTEDQICETCGSEPQPKKFPRYLQRIPKECDHDTFHCFACLLDFVPRKNVINNLLGE